MSEQQQETGFRDKANEAFNLLYFLASVHATTITPFIRTGFGVNVNGWNGVGAMLLLLFWCAADPWDQVMSSYFILWFGALLYQKARTRKLIRQGVKIHSRYTGDSWLAMKIPFFRTESKARCVEPTMCFFIGITVLPISQALGTLYMIGFLTFSIRAVIDVAATDARVQAMNDAEIEGRYYAAMRDRRGED